MKEEQFSDYMRKYINIAKQAVEEWSKTHFISIINKEQLEPVYGYKLDYNTILIKFKLHSKNSLSIKSKIEVIIYEDDGKIKIEYHSNDLKYYNYKLEDNKLVLL